MKILKSLKIFSEFETIDLETVKKKKKLGRWNLNHEKMI